jgi:L-ascorbate metabolism protein UlaG (beta-lactamase superfamily)
VRHARGQLLLHASAGFRRGALQGVRADVVYLGIGALARRRRAFREAYWDEVVRVTAARRVILVHWDNFFRPLSEPLRPMPWPLDNIPKTMNWMLRRGAADDIEVLLPVPFQPSDPFTGPYD